MPAVPLESLHLPFPAPNGVPKDVPALNRAWVDPDRLWMDFDPPPGDGDLEATVGAKETWLESASFVLDDLSFLLSLPHHRFWSQMVYDARVHPHLERVLQRLPRDHDLEQTKQPEVKEALGQIKRRLFLVFLRLSTHKESKEAFMSPSFFGKLVYDNFLLDLPRMLDLCALFRPCSPKLLEKMLSNVFTHQRGYEDDLAQSAATTVSTLESVADRADTLTQLSDGAHRAEHRSELRDLVSYVADVTVSWDAFALAYPPGCRVLHGKVRFENKLSVFYQNVIVVLCRYVIKQKETGLLEHKDFELLFSRLSLARKSCVSILRQILHQCCLLPVFEPSEDESGLECAENYLELATSLLSEGTLLVDYAKLHSLQDDLDVFAQAGIEVDAMRVRYLVEGVQALAAEMQEKVLKVETRRFDQEWSERERIMQAEAASLEPEPSKPTEGGASANLTPTGVQLDSLISQVRDLLPDLGPGFVQACLEYFDHDAEKVINAMFEQNLPPHLDEMDRAMPKTVVPQKKQEPVKPRHNVYDGDEFDIESRDHIDKSRIHKGKKKLPKDAASLLNDKSAIDKESYAPLGIVADEELVITAAGAYDANYDDEYDDTYDDNAIGQSEPDALTERRPFVLPRALGGGHVGKQVVVDDEEEEEEGADQERKRQNFVRNPEEMRAEAERRRQSKQQSRGGGGRKGQTHTPAAAPNRDVVGKPKGQGQDKSVLINRARKNANKGKGHRAAAERKQNKGMF